MNLKYDNKYTIKVFVYYSLYDGYSMNKVNFDLDVCNIKFYL